MSIRVVLADDHAPTRAGVRIALEQDGFEVCAEAADARSVVEAASTLAPDICLLDINMPGNGIAAARAIRQLQPLSSIVMLTVSRDDADLFDALCAGANGYLLKDTPASELAGRLRSVLKGETALSGALVSRVVDEFRSRGSRTRRVLGHGQRAKLTPREWEVLELLHAGRSTGEVAADLFLTPVTVRTHIAAIVRKLQVRDRKAAIALLDQR